MRARLSTRRTLPPFTSESVRRQRGRAIDQGQGVLLCQLRRLAPEPGADVHQLRTECRFPRSGAGEVSRAKADSRCISDRADCRWTTSPTRLTERAQRHDPRRHWVCSASITASTIHKTAYVRYNIDNAYIDNPSDALGDHNVIPHIPHESACCSFSGSSHPRLINESQVRDESRELPQLQLRHIAGGGVDLGVFDGSGTIRWIPKWAPQFRTSTT